MIANIIDRRARPHRFKKINAVIEAAWHDNAIPESDQSPTDDGSPEYVQIEHVTLARAIEWAQRCSGEVILYIYDEDDGLYPEHKSSVVLSSPA